MKNSKFDNQDKSKLDRYAEIIQYKPTPENIGYMHELQITGLFPHSDPKTNRYSIKDGHKRISIIGGHEVDSDKPIGVPYGSLPRLFTAYICTQAVLLESRKINLGENLSDFLQALGLNITGGKRGDITRVKKQLWKYINATISYAEAGEHEGQQYKRGIQTSLVDAYELWTGRDIHQNDMFESYLIISEALYKSLKAKPIPIDIRALKALKSSPLALDLYMWLNWRVYGSHRKNSYVSWQQVMDQCGGEYSDAKEFARKAKKWLKKIKNFWPELEYETPRGRLKILSSSSSHVKQRDEKDRH
mgnify:CR=1 FL=1|jgi:hypothetical protein